MADCNMMNLITWLTAQSPLNQSTFIQQNSETLTRFVRQHKVDRNPANEILVQKIAAVLVSLLSISISPYISEQLVALLNNMFNLDYRFIQKVLPHSNILKNLRDYCINFFKKYQNYADFTIMDVACNKVYFNLYSAVYLLAIFASHKPVSDQQTAGVKIVLHKNVIKQFLKMEFKQHPKPELFFLFSVIMVRVSKPILGNNYMNQLKNFLLPHLCLISGNEKTSFNYTHCLRLLLIHNTLSCWEIKKSKVLEFMLLNLGSPANECHLIYLLDSIRLVLMNHPNLGTFCIKKGIIELLKQSYENQPTLVLRVFEKLALVTSNKETHQLCSMFHNKIKTESYKEETLKCLSMLLLHQSNENLLEVLENRLIDDLDEIAKLNPIAGTVGNILSALDKIISTCKAKLPQIYSCVIAKINGSSIIKTAFDIGYQTKMLAERLIEKHLYL